MRMLRLSPEENTRLCALAKTAGLPPAVYARRRALSEAAPTRAGAVTADMLLHANRAALLCTELARLAADAGNGAAATKLQNAATALTNCVHRLADTPRSRGRDS